MEKERSETKTTSYSTPSHLKKIKWKLKLDHPKVLKCCRSIVGGLDGAVPGGKGSDENETSPLQQNDLNSREEKKEKTFTPKRKLDSDGVKSLVDKTTSATCVLPKNCHTFLTISHEKLGPSKGKNAEGKKEMIEINNSFLRTSFTLMRSSIPKRNDIFSNCIKFTFCTVNIYCK